MMNALIQVLYIHIMMCACSALSLPCRCKKQSDGSTQESGTPSPNRSKWTRRTCLGTWLVQHRQLEMCLNARRTRGKRRVSSILPWGHALPRTTVDFSLCCGSRDWGRLLSLAFDGYPDHPVARLAKISTKRAYITISRKSLCVHSET